MIQPNALSNGCVRSHSRSLGNLTHLSKGLSRMLESLYSTWKGNVVRKGLPGTMRLPHNFGRQLSSSHDMVSSHESDAPKSTILPKGLICTGRCVSRDAFMLRRPLTNSCQYLPFMATISPHAPPQVCFRSKVFQRW